LQDEQHYPSINDIKWGSNEWIELCNSYSALVDFHSYKPTTGLVLEIYNKKYSQRLMTLLEMNTI